MTRKNIEQILQENEINIKRDYQRLYYLFFTLKEKIDDKHQCYSLAEICNDYFRQLPLHICQKYISLKDYNISKGIIFRNDYQTFDLKILLDFCTYTYNLLNEDIWEHIISKWTKINHENKYRTFIETLLYEVEMLGYDFQKNSKDIYVLVPKDQPAISVAEVLDDDLSYRVIEYNHHSMKGDIDQKKTILFRLATKLEPQRNELKRLNKTLEDNLFFLFNNLNIRHDNVTAGDNKSYREAVAKMSPEELESWYDETYQLCLLAFLELDNVERMQKIDELKKKIKS